VEWRRFSMFNDGGMDEARFALANKGAFLSSSHVIP
jgi:hypothetical protein